MPTRYWAAVVVTAVAIILAFALVGHAETNKGAWFKSLTQPGTGVSCCDVSDCKPTASEWRGDQWWAILRGKWTPIPPDKVLKQVSILEDAVLCASQPADYYGSGHEADPVIYCFSPPPMPF
jgi:hypothetical protein